MTQSQFISIKLKRNLSYIDPMDSEPFNNRKELQKGQKIEVTEKKAFDLVKHDLAEIIETKLI